MLTIDYQFFQEITYVNSKQKIDVNIENYKYDSESDYFIDGNDDRSEETTSAQKTHLYLAIENNNVKIVKLLLSNKNIDVNMKSSCLKNESKYGSFFCDIDDEDLNEKRKRPLYI